VFDLRYHVASLTAVFVALVIGILVGVGLSGKGFVNDAERANLTRQIADLQRERDDARQSLGSATRVEQALNDVAEGAYPAVVPGRLSGKRVAVLFIGPIDRGVSFAVGKAVRDAGGTVVRTRSIGVPVDTKAVQDVLRRQPTSARLAGPDRLGDLGSALAEELVVGGKTPLWDAVDGIIVQEREGPAAVPADAVVVIRTAEPQRGATKAFLAGVYTGLERSGAPAVGTEASGTGASAIPAFSLAGLSTVDSIDTAAGRLGLVLLLGGAEPGSYGIKETARDGILPAIPPAPSQG
jgi:Copper transport outer membrane protein, MctB